MTCKECNHFFVCDEHIDDEDHVERKCSAYDFKPPCKIGDVLFAIYDIEGNGEWEIDELTVTDVGQRFFFTSSCVPPGDDVDNAIRVEEIGKTIFYTRAEAESAAAERTEHETIKQRNDGTCDRVY